MPPFLPIFFRRISFNQYSAQYSLQATGLLSHITIVEIMDGGERGMNPVAMTIINPRNVPSIRPSRYVLRLEIENTYIVLPYIKNI